MDYRHFKSAVGECLPWNSEPQPVLHEREPIRADAGSPLAWDQSACFGSFKRGI
jgi:hypothetical protein